ncbi:MAG: hypothetical protein ACTSW1_17075 [Candidatus Hodarchaeales archaeon]
MSVKKSAKFDEITQSSLLISLFSGMDERTKYFENIPILFGGKNLISDHQARLKVEEAFGQLNLPDMFKTFDFTLYRSSYEPYKLKEDLVITPYIYSVKANYNNSYLMSLFITPWADFNLSQFQEKIIEMTKHFSGLFRRTSEQIHLSRASIEDRHNECERMGRMLMSYLRHLVFDQRKMLGGTEKVSKPTDLIAVLFQRGKIERYFACLSCGNTFSEIKFPNLVKCPNCDGALTDKPIPIFSPKSISIAYPTGFKKIAEQEFTNKTFLNPIDMLYLFQSSYLPNEIRISLNKIAEEIFSHIVPLPHNALFEHRDSNDVLTLYSLSKLEEDEILIITGVADSKTKVEGSISQMALRIFIRDLNEGVKKKYSREEIFNKSILKDWILSDWISLVGEGTPEPLMSWVNLTSYKTEYTQGVELK